MAQGSAKLSKPKKSGGSQKRKAVVKKKVTKGWTQHNAKGRKITNAKRDADISKAINRKNERVISAKAIGAGNNFFLNEIKEVGQRELKEQGRERNKKESKATRMTDRLKEQLKKLK